MKRLIQSCRRLFFLLILLLFITNSSCTQETLNQRPKPNFILLVTDDQDVDSAKYMQKMNSRLKEKGVTFTNAFVTSSVCAPSRGSILTGKYPHQTGITHGYGQLHGENEKETIATILDKEGYTNVLVGKYINGYGATHPHYIPEGWDEWYAIVDENIYYNYRLNENGTLVQYDNGKDDYITDVLTAKASQFLEKNTEENPFFLYINTVAPHVPVTPADKYAKSFSELSVNFGFESDISDKPTWVKDHSKLNKPLIRKYFGNSAKMEEFYRNRWRTLLSVDDMIDALCTKLAEVNLLDNTYIVLISDNGDGVSKTIPVSPKLTPYDDGIRVPFFIKGPQVPENVEIEELVSSVDILPTLAELAGAKAYPEVSGRSLVPLFAQDPAPKTPWRDVIFAELEHLGKHWPWKSTPPSYRLIRSKEYKYIEYITSEKEYYNISNDPNERENIYPSLTDEEKKKLSARLEEVSKG